MIGVKKFVIGTAALLLAGPVIADTYSLTASWTDETVLLAPGEAARYDLKYKVTEAGGEVEILDQLTPAAAATVTADPGQQVLVSARNCSLFEGNKLCHEWSPWVISTAAWGQTVPGPVLNLQIILVRN